MQNFDAKIICDFFVIKYQTLQNFIEKKHIHQMWLFLWSKYQTLHNFDTQFVFIVSYLSHQWRLTHILITQLEQCRNIILYIVIQIKGAIVGELLTCICSKLYDIWSTFIGCPGTVVVWVYSWTLVLVNSCIRSCVYGVDVKLILNHHRHLHCGYHGDHTAYIMCNCRVSTYGDG